MIFITLGSQKFQFNRLLKQVDELIQDGLITTSVFAQIGHSDYIPKHYDYKDFLDYNEYIKIIEKADIVVTHGGTGAIINAVKRHKKVIGVPRLSKYGEHIDNHQLQIVRQFHKLNLICECMDMNELARCLSIVEYTEYREYKSNTHAIIESLETFIQNC